MKPHGAFFNLLQIHGRTLFLKKNPSKTGVVSGKVSVERLLKKSLGEILKKSPVEFLHKILKVFSKDFLEEYPNEHAGNFRKKTPRGIEILEKNLNGHLEKLLGKHLVEYHKEIMKIFMKIL